jgi:hypothetical protein
MPIPKELVKELREDTIIRVIIDNSSTDKIKLQDQITQLLIKNLLSLNEFLNPEDKTIVNKDKDTFISVINYYTITRPGKEEESSNEEKVKEVDTAKALRVVEIVKI